MEQKPKVRVFLNSAEEAAYDRERRRNQDRPAILPVDKKDGKVGWALPQWMVDAYNAVTLPRDALQGHQPTEKDIAEFALGVGGGGIAVSKATRPDADLGMFVGSQANLTEDVAKQGLRAAEMDEAGLPRERIWELTGWWKGPDGKWRTEISDENSDFTVPSEEGFNNAALEANIYQSKVPLGNYPLGSSYNHPEFFQLYPDSKNIDTSLVRRPKQKSDIVEASNYEGGYRPEVDWMGVQYPEMIFAEASNLDKARSVLLHEMQHAAQQREGFSSGVNYGEVHKQLEEIASFLPAEAVSYLQAKDRTNKTMKELNALVANDDVLPSEVEALKANLEDLLMDESAFGSFLPDEVKDIVEDVAAIREIGSHGIYQRNIGEAEARLTQKRESLKPEERSRYPWLDYDVPEDELWHEKDNIFTRMKSELEEILRRNGYLGRDGEDDNDLYAHLRELRGKNGN